MTMATAFLSDEDDLPLDPTDSVDTDGDGVGNTADEDDDGDGVPDDEDASHLIQRSLSIPMEMALEIMPMVMTITTAYPMVLTTILSFQR